jgi:hypothetical protein
MSTPYFSKFPIVNYNNKQLRDITIRAKINSETIKQNSIFLPYELEYDQKIENLSFDYYNDVNFYWLIALTNNVVDPYYDWYKSDEVMTDAITQQYGSISEAQDTVITYQRVPTSNNDPYGNVFVTPQTYDANLTIGEYQPIDAYTLALYNNDQLKSVYLINNQLTDTLENELDDAINGNN